MPPEQRASPQPPRAIYAGIDEAGYGPIFGPLVVARSVFSLGGRVPEEPFPPLWKLLKGAVCKSPRDKKRRIAVDDSKRLYAPALGLGCLERSVLAFASLTGPVPEMLDGLFTRLTGCDPAQTLTRPWYRDASGGPRLPVTADPAELKRACRRVARAADRADVRLEEAGAELVMEDGFNRLLSETGSKGALAWTMVSSHLQAIWEKYGQLSPQVVIDRQGGRIRYGELLQELFSTAVVAVLNESRFRSQYRVQERGRSMVVTVEVDSESRHLPVALASMHAKYLRELCLMRFHRYWLDKAPHVRPTYGYFGDGRRFLREIKELMTAMAIDPEHFVRRR